MTGAILEIKQDSEGGIVLGSIIANYRFLNDRSRSQVVKSANISIEYLRLIETGKRVPVRSVLGRILEAIGASEPDVIWLPEPGVHLLIRNPVTKEMVAFNFVSRVRESRQKHSASKQELSVAFDDLSQLEQNKVHDDAQLTHDEILRLECLDRAIRVCGEKPSETVLALAKEFENFVKEQ